MMLYVNHGEYLEKYGGHEMAVGLNLKRENFEKFKNKIEEVAKANYQGDFVHIIKIDKEITANEVTVENVQSLNLLEPYRRSK